MTVKPSRETHRRAKVEKRSLENAKEEGDRLQSHDHDDDFDDKKKKRTVCHRVWRLLALGQLLACLVGLIRVARRVDLRTAESTSVSKSFLSVPTSSTRDLAHLKNCTVSFQPKPKKSKDWTTKPLWVPSYPNSGAAGPSKQGDIVSLLINAMTGMETGAKNYHMSMRGGRLKRCKSTTTETAACTQAHPVVPVDPEKHKSNFDRRVVFVIRNFLTAFPAMHNDKAIAYHKHIGQVDEEDWREARDTWMKGSFQQWKDMVWTWKRMDEHYQLALYLPYEQLLDADRGPPLLERLARPFADAGFETAPPNDLPCIWYQIVVQQEWKRRAQFYKYTPGYTTDQTQWLLAEMLAFAKEAADDGDGELAHILNEYVAEIRGSARIDKPWTNTSLA